MKSIKLILVKFVLWIEVSCIAACSSIGAINPPATISPVSTSTSPVAIMPTSLPFTGKIVFIGFDKISDNNRVYVMTATGGELTDISPPNLLSIEDLSWSPDGQYIAFDAFKNGAIQIFKMKLIDSNLAQLTFGEKDSYLPSWSPDGERIMFISSSQDILGNNDRPVQQIYTMKSDGAEVHHLIVATKAENTPMSGSYRNDGFISVSEPITRHSYVNYIVSSDGVIQEQFPEFVTDFFPVWSPDNKFVLLSTLRTDCSGIVIMKADDSKSTCLIIGKKATTPLVYAGAASWSPDGNYIIFSANIENNNGIGNIYVMKPDESELTRLTYLSEDVGGAVWSPEP